MATIQKNFGAITAYGLAKEAGYTGTKQEFQAGLIESATAAQTATQKAQEAAKSATGAATAQTASEDAQTASESARDDALSYRDQTQALHASVMAAVGSFLVGPAYNVGVTVSGTQVSICWSDPADNLKDDLTAYAYWAKTRLVMKTGGFPENETDGVTLAESTTRHQYRDTPFVWDAGVVSDYYFALFTCTTGGQWNCDDNAPRFTTESTSLRTLMMMIRNGTAELFPGLSLGAVLSFKPLPLYSETQFRVIDLDYKGDNEDIRMFHRDQERIHNIILMPEYLPRPTGSNTYATAQFDAAENSYGRTAHEVFQPGYAYYALDVATATYSQLEAGTDYTVGDAIADYQEPVYEKNHNDRVSYGCNSWKESNMRQWLNATGSPWFEPQNPFDVAPSASAQSVGLLGCFDQEFRECIQPVYNKTARNTIAATNHGGGGGYDTTLDTVWLPGLTEFDGQKVNGIADGAQFRYFSEIAVTNADRIMYDLGGTARHAWLRSANASSVRASYFIYTSGASLSNSYCSLAYGVPFAIALA